MKEEILKQHDEAVASANEALYQAAFAEGKAEGFKEGQESVGMVDTTPYSEEDVAKKVEEATAPLKTKIAEMELADAQKDELEEAIADQMAALQNSIRALHQKQEAPMNEEVQG